VDNVLTLAIVLYSVNAVFFAGLAYIYGRTWLSTRARYPLGLFVFSLLLLVHSAGTAGAYVMFSGYLGDAAPYMSMMAAFELVGVGILAKITL
jgi:hypothetical protein